MPRKPPPKEHQFKPGQSGNPGGRPKGQSITARLRRRLEEDDGRLAEAIVAVMIREAAKGKFHFTKEILDRIEGRSPGIVEISGAVEVKQPRELLLERIAGQVAALAEEGNAGGADANGSERAAFDVEVLGTPQSDPAAE